MKFWNHIISPVGMLCAILLFAFVFRVSGIDSRDIWYDELLTIQQSEKSISEINKDVPTPIHYYFVHMFMLFGKSTLVLGIPSVIFGLCSVLLVFLTTKRIADERTGLIAAFLIAISPMLIEFSQQILFFSYFTFFSSLILYIITDFATHFEQGKFKWSHLLLLVFLNWVNVLTQMLALVLIPVQLLFLCYLFARNPKVMLIFKKYLVWIPILIGVLFSVLLSIGSGGYVSFLETLHIGFERPITVGYSLSGQLGSTVIASPIKFFQAMFSWFGIGGGVGLLVYLCFFIIGVAILFFRKTSRSIAFLFTSWLTVPFVVLFSVRIEHWFEEKYFIFMIPVYLILIALGISFLSEYIGRRVVREKLNTLKSKGLAVFFLVLILGGIAFLAVEPIKSRTTFGFPFKGYAEYSWRSVYDYLKKNMSENDKVFLVKGGSDFLDYYYASDKNDSLLLDEEFIMKLSAEEYSRLVEGQGKNYFISIPDYNYLFLNDVTTYEKIKMVGNFGIYTIRFKKESPVRIKRDLADEWEYYEDFRTSRYIGQAYDWKNIVTTYSDASGILETEGFNQIVPKSPGESFIDYKFLLPEGTRSFYLKSGVSLDRGSSFQILIGESQDALRVVYDQSAVGFSSFLPEMKIDYDTKKSKEMFLRLRFNQIPTAPGEANKSGLKFFSLSSHQYDGARFPGDYTLQKSVKGSLPEYTYNAFLEIEKSSKWTHASIASEGWIQTNDGFLIRIYGTKDDNPLVFKFATGEEKRDCDLEIKSFASHDNPLVVYASQDGETWDLLKKMNDHVFAIDTFSVKGIVSGNLFLKFSSEILGSSSQIRNIKVSCTEK